MKANRTMASLRPGKSQLGLVSICELNFDRYSQSHCRLEEILTGLNELINSKEDDVRAYPLPSSPRIFGIGKNYFPNGIMLIERGHDLLFSEKAA